MAPANECIHLCTNKYKELMISRGEKYEINHAFILNIQMFPLAKFSLYAKVSEVSKLETRRQFSDLIKKTYTHIFV